VDSPVADMANPAVIPIFSSTNTKIMAGFFKTKPKRATQNSVAKPNFPLKFDPVNIDTVAFVPADSL
jgi:hypothetical protein